MINYFHAEGFVLALFLRKRLWKCKDDLNQLTGLVSRIIIPVTSKSLIIESPRTSTQKALKSFQNTNLAFFSLQIFSEGWRRLYTGLALLVSACLQRMHWSLLNIKKFFFTWTCSKLRHTFWCFFGSFNCLLTFSHHLVVEHWYNLPILFYCLRLFVSSGYYSCIWFSASSLISFFYHGKHSTGELSR